MSEEKLQQLEDEVTRLTESRIRTDEKLKGLRAQKATIVEELTSLGVNPNSIDAAITALETSINTQLNEIEAQIPNEEQNTISPRTS